MRKLRYQMTWVKQFGFQKNYQVNKSRILQNLVPFVELLKQNGAPYFYFAGGCLRDILLGKKPNDYDMFTTSSEDAEKLIDVLKSLSINAGKKACGLQGISMHSSQLLG